MLKWVFINRVSNTWDEWSQQEVLLTITTVESGDVDNGYYSESTTVADAL
jgi:hypothetical protein